MQLVTELRSTFITFRVPHLGAMIAADFWRDRYQKQPESAFMRSYSHVDYMKYYLAACCFWSLFADSVTSYFDVTSATACESSSTSCAHAHDERVKKPVEAFNNNFTFKTKKCKISNIKILFTWKWLKWLFKKTKFDVRCIFFTEE